MFTDLARRMFGQLCGLENVGFSLCLGMTTTEQTCFSPDPSGPRWPCLVPMFCETVFVQQKGTTLR